MKLGVRMPANQSLQLTTGCCDELLWFYGYAKYYSYCKMPCCALLLQKNLHVLEVKGHRIGLEEIVADHARKVEAKHIFPGERSIVKTRDVAFLYVSEGKLMDGVRHDFQLSASAGSFVSFVFLQLDPGFFDNRLSQFNARTRQSCVDEEERRRARLRSCTDHHVVGP